MPPARHTQRSGPATAVLLLTLALIAAACDQWSGVGYGPARTSWNAAETELGPTEVDELTEVWQAPLPAGTSQPAIDDGRVHVAADTVRTFPLAAGASCSGTPLTCPPAWTSVETGMTEVSVSGGVVYATGPGVLRAYDAAGVQGCSGTPTTCTALWSATLPPGAAASPAITGGRVYVTAGQLLVFDAAGSAGCGGTPTTCAPLWSSSGTARGGAAISGGVAYVVQPGDAVTPLDAIVAYDAAGTTGCGGTPATCAPLRTYDLTDDDECFPHGCVMLGPPTVSVSDLFVASTVCCSMAMGKVTVHRFDATGVDGCAGSPTVCVAVDATAVPGVTLPYADGPLAVADGLVYVSTFEVTAFDAATLDLRWRSGAAASGVSVADGVAHLLAGQQVGPSWVLRPRALDAAGVVGCSGTPPVCTPLWTGSASGPMDSVSTQLARIPGPAVAEHHVAARTDALRVYTRP